MKERVGAALSLDKFATAKVSKYDKRKLIEKQRALKAKQFNKYKKLKKRLEASSAPLNVSITAVVVSHVSHASRSAVQPSEPMQRRSSAVHPI